MSIDDLAEAYSTTLTSLIDQYAPRIVVQKHYRPITPLVQCGLSCGEKEGAL